MLHNSQNVNIQLTVYKEKTQYFGSFFLCFLHIFNCDFYMKKILNVFIVIIICFPTFIFNYKDNSVSSLIDNVIFIDPGHGGKDNGTSYEFIVEDELNLKISTYLYEMILDEGAMCYLTRNNDYDLSYSYSKNHKVDDLNNRIKYIDSFNTSLFVSIHLNYYPNDNVNGIQVFYQKHNENSKVLANTLQSVLNKENSKDKKTKVGNYYLLENSKTTGVIIECGFLSSSSDRKKLMNDSYLKHLASLIKKGINEYLLLNKPQ